MSYLECPCGELNNAKALLEITIRDDSQALLKVCGNHDIAVAKWWTERAELHERIASLEADLLAKEEQIGGLTSELEQMRGRYEAEWKALADAQREIKDLRQQLAEQRRATDCICEAKSMLDEQYKHQEQQLAASQRDLQRVRQDRDGIVANAIDLIGSDACDRHGKHIRQQSFGEFVAERRALGCTYCAAEQFAASQAEAAALRGVVLECAEWLESRPDYTEGDAATSSMARGILATPSAAAERMQARDATIRECLEGIIEQRVGDLGRCVTLNCDCSECLARTALAALDAATAKETLTVEEVKGHG